MESLFTRYAIGLLECAVDEKKDLVSLREQIKIIFEISKKESRLARFLSSNNVFLEQKFDFIETCFSQFDKLIINFIKLIVKQSRGVFLYDIFKESLLKFDAYLNVERGIVYSSSLLSDEEMKRIKLTIEHAKNKIVELDNIVDPSIIGGIKIVLNNDIYDSTINKKLENMRKLLLKGEN